MHSQQPQKSLIQDIVCYFAYVAKKGGSLNQLMVTNTSARIRSDCCVNVSTNKKVK